MKGFTFPTIRREGEEYTLTLLVNASEIVNNTNVQCEFDASGSLDREKSAIATLLVISSK